MSSEIFKEYRYTGGLHKGGPVAAVQVERTNVQVLSQITGWTAVSQRVRGGSMLYSELRHGAAGISAKIGDYIVAGDQNAFLAVPKDFFELHWELKGNLPPSSERR